MDTATLFVRMEQSAVTFRLGQVPTSLVCPCRFRQHGVRWEISWLIIISTLHTEY